MKQLDPTMSLMVIMALITVSIALLFVSSVLLLQ